MEVPFWEETYKDDTVFTFGNQPNQSITAIENLLDKSGRVLDVGCGDGKNSLYLAKQGFRNIDAFDLSVNAIEKLRRLAVAHSLEINAWTGNLCSFSFVKEYSLTNAVIFVKPEMYGTGKRNNCPHQLAPGILYKTD